MLAFDRCPEAEPGVEHEVDFPFGLEGVARVRVGGRIVNYDKSKIKKLKPVTD
jgi:hypothetical protein